MLTASLVPGAALGKGGGASKQAFQKVQSKTLNVMTFNILAASISKDKGCVKWTQRRKDVRSTILKHAPDIVGLQEVQPVQLRYLDQALPGYGSSHGRGARRSKRKSKAEFTPIYYSKSRFKKVMAHHGSYKSSKQERVWNLVRLYDRRANRHYLVINTHWESRHSRFRNKEAVELAALIRRLMISYAEDRLLVLGDFNARYQNNHKDVSIKNLLIGFPLVESHCGRRLRKEGTSHSKCKGKSDGKRIDHIFFSAPRNSWLKKSFWKNSHKNRIGAVNAACGKSFGEVKQVVVDKSYKTTAKGKKRLYPSDHFPVVTKFLLGK